MNTEHLIGAGAEARTHHRARALRSATRLAAIFVLGVLGTSSAAMAAPAMIVSARTPWGVGPTFTTPPSPLECAQCSFNSASSLAHPYFNAFGFNALGAGETDVLFPRVRANTAGDPSFEFTAPFGTNGVSCFHMVDVVPNSTDVEAAVACDNGGGIRVPSRVQLMQRYDPSGTITGAFGDIGYVTYDGTQGANGTIINWASSNGQAPIIDKYGTGHYGITFNGLSDPLINGGNVQLSTRTENRNCYIWWWNNTPAFGEVFCFDSTAPSGTWAEASIAFSYSQSGIGGGAGSAATAFFLTDDCPTCTGTYTPTGTFVYTYTSGVNPTVTRNGPGQYQVNWSGTLPGGALTPLVTTIVDDAELFPTCAAVDITKNSVSIDCTVNGLPTDSFFSLEVDSNQDTTASLPSGASGFGLTTAVNMNTIYDVSDNIVCADECPTAPCGTSIACFIGTSPGGTPASFPMLPTGNGTGLVCGGPAPNGLRSLAVHTNGTPGIADGYDPRNTYVLALGVNSIVNYCSGIASWPISQGPQFSGSWGTLVSPVMEGTGAAVQLRQIVSVRYAGAQAPDLLGLTGDNTIVQADLPQGKWIPASSYPMPAGTIQSLSHGVNDLYVWMSAGAMYRVTKNEASPTQLPALPSGLQPVAMGGRFVITNSGRNSSGKYTCTANNAGLARCVGDGNRFYRLDGRYGTDVWQLTGGVTIGAKGQVTAPNWPWNNIGATSNPIMELPTIVDAGLMGGDNDSFIIWENQSRIYDYYPAF
jgi:hypothetical protein